MIRQPALPPILRETWGFLCAAWTLRAQAPARARQWLNTLAHEPSAAAERSYPARLLAVFIASRLLFAIPLWTVARGFNTDAIAHSMHLIDPQLLQTAFWQSLWYEHTQPPLMNALTGVVLLLTPNGFEAAVLYPFFTLLGWWIALGTYRLARAVGVPARLALTAAALFTVSPAALYYETWYGYAIPATCAVLWGVLFLGRWWSGARRGTSLMASFTCMAAATGLHSLFMLPWMLVVALAVLAASPGRRARALLWMLLPLLAATAVPLKNYSLYGFFGSSSWTGITAAYLVNVFNPDDALRQRLYAEGKISILAFAPRPDMDLPVPRLPTPYNALPPSGIPVLDEPFKPSGEINFNNKAYAKLAPVFWHDAVAILKERPSIYWSTLQNAMFIYLLPVSDYLHLRSKTATAPWDWAWNLATAGRLGWSQRPAFHHLFGTYGYTGAFAPTFGQTLARTPWYLVGWLNFLVIPGLLFVAAWTGLARGILGRGNATPAQRALLAAMAYMAAYVTFMSVVCAITENQRYRLYISPLNAVYVAMVAHLLLGARGAARKKIAATVLRRRVDTARAKRHSAPSSKKAP